jgi:hypothetical protein
MMETRAMPMTRAYLTLKAIRKAVTMPPQNMASHICIHTGQRSLFYWIEVEKLELLTVGFVIWPPLHAPVTALIISGGQPPKLRGVAVPPPVMAPIPDV